MVGTQARSVTVQGSNGAVWTVTVSRDGQLYCNCPSWKFQRIAPALRVCKHTQQVAAIADAVRAA
jgi:hypothetical protein